METGVPSDFGLRKYAADAGNSVSYVTCSDIQGAADEDLLKTRIGLHPKLRSPSPISTKEADSLLLGLPGCLHPRAHIDSVSLDLGPQWHGTAKATITMQFCCFADPFAYW